MTNPRRNLKTAYNFEKFTYDKPKEEIGRERRQIINIGFVRRKSRAEEEEVAYLALPKL
jgi:hypothetical protein